MQKSQFGEQIWQFFGETFPDYIQNMGNYIRTIQLVYVYYQKISGHIYTVY